jgi:hypothetical protein
MSSPPSPERRTTAKWTKKIRNCHSRGYRIDIASIIAEVCSALIAMLSWPALSFCIWKRCALDHPIPLLHLIVNWMQREPGTLTETALRAHNVPFISSKRETIPSEGWWDKKERPRVVKPAEKEVS